MMLHKVAIMLNMFLPLFFLFVSASYGENELICPQRVRTFSLGAFNRSYFECKKEGERPVLKECPEDEMYWPSKEKCVTRPRSNLKNKNSPEHNDLYEFTAPVLGRPVYLGCLFDAQRNKIKPADSFWKETTIKENKKRSTSYSSDVSYYAVQSTFDRLAHMDISASLKMEFLGGLVTVEGSAAYLKDSVESKRTVAFVLKAHYITRSETLPTSTTKDFNDVCKLNDVTHVVTSITYGMDAFFVFKKTVKAHESKEKIEGSLKLAIKSIPTIKVEGGIKAIISGDLKEKIKGIDAKLRGDFVLEVQPTTYNESVLVFKTLTKHLGEKPDYADASKMKMILTPVTRFCDQATKILMDISQTLVDSVTKMMNKIEQTKLKVKTIQLMDAVQSYIPLSKIMSTFANRLEVFELELKSELQTILPKIRGGGKDSGEKDLVALLTRYKSSPFYYDTSRRFLKTRHREIEALDDMLNPDIFKGTQVEIVDYEEAGDIKTLYKKNVVLLLKFNLLPNVSIVEEFLGGKDIDETKSWFNNKEIVSTLGQMFRNFMEFAAANKHSDERGYLFAMHNANKRYVTVYAQKNKIKSDNFTFPVRPQKMVIRSSTYNTVTFRTERPRNTWVIGFAISLWKYGRKEEAVERDFEFNKGKEANYEVSGLVPNEVYVFTMKYVTKMGSSPYGFESIPVVIKPCSPPSNIKSKNISSTSFTIYWEPPLYIGEGVDIVSYNVEVTKGDDVIKTQKTDNYCNVTFDALKPATIYNVSVQAVANTQIYNGTKGERRVTPTSAKAWFLFATSPDSPFEVMLVTISYHSAKITWTPPVIAVGAVVRHYVVKYVLLNNFGNKSISSKMELSSGTNTTICITDLVQGSTYGISVKVVTSKGTSGYSSVLTVKTKFKETELDSLRRSVEKEIKHSVSASTKKLETSMLAMQKNLGGRIRDVKEDGKRMITSMEKNRRKIRENQIRTNALNESLIDRVGDIERDFKSIPQLYYPKYKLEFVGNGCPTSYSYAISKSHISFEQCIDMCVEKRKNGGHGWNRMYYRWSDQYCYCYKNGSGHSDNSGCVHYRFA